MDKVGAKEIQSLPNRRTIALPVLNYRDGAIRRGRLQDEESGNYENYRLSLGRSVGVGSRHSL